MVDDNVTYSYDDELDTGLEMRDVNWTITGHVLVWEHVANINYDDSEDKDDFTR